MDKNVLAYSDLIQRMSESELRNVYRITDFVREDVHLYSGLTQSYLRRNPHIVAHYVRIILNKYVKNDPQCVPTRSEAFLILSVSAKS